MIRNAKYVHTNVIARDWRALSRFYQDVFGCTPVLPERYLSGRDLEAGTGLAGARLEGVHLRLPGYEGEGPTLEVFQYASPAEGLAAAVNRPGFAHLAFSVDSVAEARDHVLQAGGSAIGEVVTMTISPQARVTWCYVRDPEGNILELQSWSVERAA
jgi:catechol 2,3-dioxygenase-like lactoylglutathione lyase family enzyme